jgi:hypothetical protein
MVTLDNFRYALHLIIEELEGVKERLDDYNATNIQTYNHHLLPSERQQISIASMQLSALVDDMDEIVTIGGRFVN